MVIGIWVIIGALAVSFAIVSFNTKERVARYTLFISILLSLLFLMVAGALAQVIREGKDACEAPLPRTQKCVMLFVPDVKGEL